MTAADSALQFDIGSSPVAASVVEPRGRVLATRTSDAAGGTISPGSDGSDAEDGGEGRAESGGAPRPQGRDLASNGLDERDGEGRRCQDRPRVAGGRDHRGLTLERAFGTAPRSCAQAGLRVAAGVRILDRGRCVPGLCGRRRARRAGAGYPVTGEQDQERNDGGVAAISKQHEQPTGPGARRMPCAWWPLTASGSARERRVCVSVLAPPQHLREESEARRSCARRLLHGRFAFWNVDRVAHWRGVTTASGAGRPRRRIRRDTSPAAGC
jgi:hypothetical protein